VSIGSPALVALAALCWGLSGGIGAMLVADGWSPAVVSFHRGAVGLVFVLAWLILGPHGRGLRDARLWLYASIAGLGVAGNFGFYFLSIAEGSVSIAATLMYCAPVFVFLASFALGLERPSAFKWGAIAAVVAGVVMLTGVYEAGPRAVTTLGIAAGLGAGLSYALFIFAFKAAARRGSPQEVLTVALAMLVVVLAWPSRTGEIVAVVGDASAWPLFLTLGVLGAGVSFICYVVGLRRTAPTVASMLAMIEPVTASLFGVMLLGDTLSAPQLAGMAVILATVTTMSLRSEA
jgi:drug/metabolite transporter (DMT)-like permease